MGRLIPVVLAGLALAACSGYDTKVSGFSHPESVVHDPLADQYFVSNVNGEATAADDNGFISRLAPDGRILQLRFIDGADAAVTLNAPKGMAVVGDTLYVADLDTVRHFDRVTGEPLGALAVPGAHGLNGIAAAADGTLYVTDPGWDARGKPTGGEAIYRIPRAGPVTVVARPAGLAEPNGIVAFAGGIYVAGWRSGSVYRIEGDGTMGPVLQLPKNLLDGLVRRRDGSLLVSSWEGECVYAVSEAGLVTRTMKSKSTPGIGYDAVRDRVLLPLWDDDAVAFRNLADD